MGVSKFSIIVGKGGGEEFILFILFEIKILCKIKK